MKRTFKNILLSLTVAALCLAGAEVYIRCSESGSCLYIEDSLTDFRLNPGYKGEYPEVNSLGFHDHEFDRGKSAGIKRIMALGDSTTFGRTSLEESYPEQLEQILNRDGKKYLVINAGFGGYSTRNEMNFLKYYGMDVKPDTVILGFFTGNDIFGNTDKQYLFARNGVVFPVSFKNAEENMNYLRVLSRKSRLFSRLDELINPVEKLERAMGKHIVRMMIDSIIKARKLGLIDDSGFVSNMQDFYRTVSSYSCSVEEIRETQVHDELTALLNEYILSDGNRPETISRILKHYISKVGMDETAADLDGRLKFLNIQLRRSDIYYPDYLPANWSNTGEYLKEIAMICEEKGIDLRVLIIPDRTQVSPWLQAECARYHLPRGKSPDFNLPNIRLAEMLEKLGIRYADALPYFIERGDSLFGTYDTHCNKEGNAVLASAAYELLN